MQYERGEFNSPEQPKLLWEKIIIRYIPRIAVGMLVGVGVGIVIASMIIFTSTKAHGIYSSESLTAIYDNFVITHTDVIRKTSAAAGAMIGGVFAAYATHRKWV